MITLTYHIIEYLANENNTNECFQYNSVKLFTRNIYIYISLHNNHLRYTLNHYVTILSNKYNSTLYSGCGLVSFSFREILRNSNLQPEPSRLSDPLIWLAKLFVCIMFDSSVTFKLPKLNSVKAITKFRPWSSCLGSSTSFSPGKPAHSTSRVSHSANSDPVYSVLPPLPR